MSYSLKRLSRSVGVAVAALGLGLGALLVVSPGPATAGPGTPPLDHFLCYQSTGKGFVVNPNLLLKNVIQPAPFHPVRVGAISTHCNPANKSVPVAVFRSKNPLAHLLCWSIGNPIKPVKVVVANQFGKATMTAGSPNRLCLPTWKSLVALPNMTPVQPPRLDHFVCYPLAALAASYGFKAPAFVKVQDEFNVPKFTAVRIGTANLLCVPTTKIIPGATFPPQTPTDLSLVCFPINSTPIFRVVFDQNQFGQGAVLPTPKAEQLCLPSTLQVPVSPGA